MNKCTHCGQYTSYDDLICEKCREEKERQEDDGSLDIHEGMEDSYLLGLDKVVKRKEKPESDRNGWSPFDFDDF